jgi:hypothetical protein
MSARLLLSLAAIWALALCPLPAAAHLTPNSEVRLEPRSGQIRADIIVPLGEYAYATGNPVDGSPASLATARAYLLSRFAVSAPDGSAWKIVIDKIEFAQIAGPPDLHATARLIPPPGTDSRRFAIDWRVVVDSLPSHFALFVTAGEDRDRTILGAVRQGRTRLTVNLREPGTGNLFASAVSLGVQHIAGGYDHLLFLLALLLPAPLIARGGRWKDPRGSRDTLGQLARIVTAFTIGHSMTLIGATLGGWKLPTAPVEIAIAISVLVSAIHAIRPLVPGREALIAAGFGLVHGLAFATLVLKAEASAASSAASLLGFNLGIELVQLAVVLAVAPSLLLLSRSRWYGPIRLGLASFAAIASVGWIVNRTTGAGVGFVQRVEGVMAHAAWAVVALAVAALLTTASQRMSSPTARSSQQGAT